MRRSLTIYILLLLAMALPAGARGAPDPVAAALSEEAVALDSGVLRAFARAVPGQNVLAAAWPLAPGRRADVLLTRHEVYAANARIVAIENGKEVEVPRSRLRFFWGRASDELETPVLVIWDPETGGLEATSFSGPASYRLRRDAKAGEGGYRIARSEEDLSAPAWSCGEEDLSTPASAPAASPLRRNVMQSPLLTGTYTAIFAVDTDNEFMQIKFLDNTTSATNYIATLFATMNSQTYNPDFTTLNLVQGYTVLRPSTTPDPWLATGGGNADGTKLNEFTNYWSANYGFVTRALALILSGKQSSGFSASGIAWRPSGGGLCSTGVGYSFSQVFTGGDFFSSIAQLVAHEIGHNLGAPHTHCEALDQCYAAQPGCYSGPTSCPVGGSGTLMSYCHLLGGCSATAHFHPFQQAYVNTNITNAIGSCVFPLVSGAAIPSGVAPPQGPASGGTSVTINGSNFAAGATVTVNGVATQVTGTTPTQITALTGSGAPGWGNVVVTNPSQSGATLTNAFFYHFNDVPPANGFYSFINKLLTNAVTAGCGSNNYCPTSSVTRGQMAVFLLRSKDGSSYTPPACVTPIFGDVPCSNGFAIWINELANRGITSGCGSGNYCPNNPVTRQQMAVFLVTTFNLP
jgi:metallopeptidase family M12-like protein/IPT/TIG domain-containing protein/S-layer family protein